jgi:hypothetical protein
VDLYIKPDWYRGIKGIFLDQVTTNCADARGRGYFAMLSQYIRSLQLLVIMNPGTQSTDSECFMDVADILVTFEDTYLRYAASYTKYPWNFAYPSYRFWHLVYSATDEAAMRQTVALSRQRNAGWVFVTNRTFDMNPWFALPDVPYWREEVRAVASPTSP